MANMQVPNPYSQGVQETRPTEMGLVSAPMQNNPANERAADYAAHQKEFAQAMQKYQDEVDRTRVMDLTNQLDDVVQDLTYGEKGYQKLEGVNALERPDGKSLAEEMDDGYQTRAAAIIAKAGNQKQRMMITEISSRMRQGLRGNVDGWMIRQQQAYTAAVEADKLERAGRKALSTDPAESESGFYLLRETVSQQAKRKGVPADYASVLGPLHLERAADIVDAEGPDAGKSYLKRYRQEMTPAQISKLNDIIDSRREAETITNLTGNILSKGYSKKDALAQVDSRTAPEIRGKVRKLVEDAYDTVEVARKERVDELTNEIYKAYANRQAIPTLVKQELKELDPKKYTELFDGNGVFLEYGKAPANSDSQTLAYLEGLEWVDPDEFSLTSLEQYAHKLSKADYTRLQTVQKKYGNSNYKQFQKELKLRMQMDNIDPSTPKGKKILKAGEIAYDQAAVNYKGGIPKEQRQDIVATIFTETPGFFSDTPMYSRILEKPDQSVSQTLMEYRAVNEQGAKDYYAKRVEGFKDITGLDSMPTWENLNDTQKRAFISLATGFGWPSDLFEEARKKVSDYMQEDASKGIYHKVDNQTVEAMLVYSLFKSKKAPPSAVVKEKQSTEQD